MESFLLIPRACYDLSLFFGLRGLGCLLFLLSLFILACWSTLYLSRSLTDISPFDEIDHKFPFKYNC